MDVSWDIAKANIGHSDDEKNIIRSIRRTLSREC